MDLTTGWQKHNCVPGGFHLVTTDDLLGEISIVTGPKGSGLMASNDPGRVTTYEVWFPGMSSPTGHMTLDEIRGVLKYLRQRHAEDREHQ